MTQFDVIVPALTLRTVGGGVDQAATRRYAERAATTWVDLLLISGSTTRGHLLTTDERAGLLDLWLEVVSPDRLLACCWEPADFAHAADRHVTPMAVMRLLLDSAAAMTFLWGLPRGATIYSHPMFDGRTFDAQLAALARTEDVLPLGGKLAKVTPADVADIHAAAPEFRIWDGSSRRIAQSLTAGASGIVATPLCVFPNSFPKKTVDSIQSCTNEIQTDLDKLPTRDARTTELLRRAAIPFV